MVKNVNVEQGVKGDYVAIRVIIPRSTYKALKVKCALNDITVKEYIIGVLDKSVKGIKRDIEAMQEKA